MDARNTASPLERSPSGRVAPVSASLAALIFLTSLPGTARAGDTALWPTVPALDETQAVRTFEASHDSTFARQVRAAYWRDRTCETPGCRTGRSGNFVDVASFGFAAAGGVLLARRRNP